MTLSQCTDVYRQIIHTHSKEDKIKNPWTKRSILPFKHTGLQLIERCHQLPVVKSACDSATHLPFVRYEGNSCYKDTLLLSLFLRPPTFIQKTILDRNVQDIPYTHPFLCGSTRVQHIENVSSIQYAFRKLSTYFQLFSLDKNQIMIHSMNRYLDPILKQYCPNQRIHEFTQQRQNDPETFAQLLFELFPLDKKDRGQIRRKTYYYNRTETQRRKGSVIDEDLEAIYILSNESLSNHPSSLFEIDPDIYITYQKTLIDEPPHGIPPTFLLKKDIVSLRKFPKLFFIKVQRADYGSTHFLSKAVFPNLTLSKASLHLFAIVCKLDRNIESGHYGGFIRCLDTWYFYDDLHPSHHLVKIGSFSTLFHHTQYAKIALTQSILLLYNHSKTILLKQQRSLISFLKKQIVSEQFSQNTNGSLIPFPNRKS